MREWTLVVSRMSETNIYHRGKTLGGSSSINGMSWTRGAEAQYDIWSDLLDPQDLSLEWNWNSMLTYMKKVRTQIFTVGYERSCLTSESTIHSLSTSIFPHPPSSRREQRSYLLFMDHEVLCKQPTRESLTSDKLGVLMLIV